MVIASQLGDSSISMFAEEKQGFVSQGYSTYFSEMPHKGFYFQPNPGWASNVN